ncbi:unnamed protein product [Cuscuta europaea]|uniref:Uncharacterized protein n=1 Tax=Cuscuta europaea TaxID=41803 RepID=A0A9P0YJB7_CUSEU|nr:unnamed protein product [Cuscuta europaea]
MVLWEVTLATAYFLGLKRTYRLALRIQRRVISPKYPKISQFARKRTRDVFDVALNVHQKIQERDLEAGRNLGNWILRWLDKAKPAANIRGRPLHPPHSRIDNGNRLSTKQQVRTTSTKKFDHPNGQEQQENNSNSRHLFTSSSSSLRNTMLLPKTFPTVAMMMRPAGTPTSIHHQYRQFISSNWRLVDSTKADLGNFSHNIIREDIMQWIRRGP